LNLPSDQTVANSDFSRANCATVVAPAVAKEPKRPGLLLKLHKATSPIRSLLARSHLVVKRYSFTGAYPDREAALSSVPRGFLAGYDNKEVVPVSRQRMQELKEWDYPVIFWLDRLIREKYGKKIRLLDAGGHTGTKYIAFSGKIDLSCVDWLIYDLPPMVAAGRELAQGLPIVFTSELKETGMTDILLCSGLLQYLDVPFPEFIRSLPNRPDTIILNKVALRDGPTVVTLERIGPAYVPYTILNAAEFHDQLDDLGYEVVDTWTIEALSHRILSHPELGLSRSAGFVLRRNRNV